MQELKCDSDVRIRLRAAGVVLHVFAALMMGHLIAVIVAAWVVRQIDSIDAISPIEVYQKPVVRPRTEPVLKTLQFATNTLCSVTPVQWSIVKSEQGETLSSPFPFFPFLFFLAPPLPFSFLQCFSYSTSSPVSTGMSNRVWVRLPEAALYFGMYPSTQVDPAFYPPRVGKMSTSQRW